MVNYDLFSPLFTLFMDIFIHINLHFLVEDCANDIESDKIKSSLIGIGKFK